jgi:hypothetical protein
MDANSGELWCEMDISDLTNEIAHGRTMAETASLLLPGRGRDPARRRRSWGWPSGPQIKAPPKRGVVGHTNEGDCA